MTDDFGPIEPDNFEIDPDDLDSGESFGDDLQEKVYQAQIEHAEKIEAFIAMLHRLSIKEHQDDIPWQDVVLVHERAYEEGTRSIKERYWLEVRDDD